MCGIRFYNQSSYEDSYVALFSWSLAIWVSWNPLIDNRQHPTADTDRSVHVIDLIGRLLFAIFICSTILLFEKFSIQWIAGKFHERSYAERIADQKFAVKSLVIMYQNSTDTGRSDALGSVSAKAVNINPRKLFKRAIKGVRTAATTTTTALGNMAVRNLCTSRVSDKSTSQKLQEALSCSQILLQQL